MRPIDKGSIPIDPSGVPISINHYQQSRGYLISRLGTYCSYCERYLGNNIAVEHIQPKSSVPGLSLSWDNFLLACVNCNSIKSKTPVILGNYLWPDRDNTYRAIEYSFGGMVSVVTGLTPQLTLLTNETIKLTGLDRTPDDDLLVNPEQKDLRWSERRKAFGKAEHAKTRLTSCNTNEMREQIIDTATSTGFFSIWLKVFEHDEDMRVRLINAFPGSSSQSFNSMGIAIQRAGGHI